VASIDPRYLEPGQLQQQPDHLSSGGLGGGIFKGLFSGTTQTSSSSFNGRVQMFYRVNNLERIRALDVMPENPIDQLRIKVYNWLYN